ncbi:fasciclin domain-containing protein [Kitasatospora aureofaciens]
MANSPWIVGVWRSGRCSPGHLPHESRRGTVQRRREVFSRIRPGRIAACRFLGDRTRTTPDFTVDTNAKVLCGNVQTANATVHIVDTVLTPAPDPHP